MPNVDVTDSIVSRSASDSSASTPSASTSNDAQTSDRFNDRIVLAARVGNNADALKDVLETEAQVQVESPTVKAVSLAIEQEAALVVLTEEVLADNEQARDLGDRISHQPEWSDIPVIILLTQCQRFGDCLALLGQTTHHRSVLLLELPLKRMIFATVVRACLQNRRRQFRLRDTLFQLQESNQALENFSYTAAHELRNPLGIAKTSFDLLGRTSLTTQQQKFVDLGQRTTQRMNQLIGTLLNYSKIKAAKDDFAAVDMTSVIKEAIDGLQMIIAERQADVSWNDLPTVQGSRQLLIQLMSNLIKNAIVHNPSAGSKVVISAVAATAFETYTPNQTQENGSTPKPEHTGLSSSTDPNRWFFFVADNGPGIAPEIQSQIFDMFNRAGKSRASGSGIGLALCQRVAQQHGTTIRVKSQPGSGSTFYFDLSAFENG